MTDDSVMTEQRIRKVRMMMVQKVQRVIQKVTKIGNDGTRKVNYNIKIQIKSVMVK